jgi:hypothetical protein
MKSYVLVEIEDPTECEEAPHLNALIREQWGEATKVRTADVTDRFTYNRTTPGDPWAESCPADVLDMVRRLS